ncbi:glycoside hydrolase family 16 protein [Hebeloma cylindrosporum]|uniref:Glycoside hydrolase family 16 protein n=1 Tax=Hebeloma cylindrosporum TaxID=76867 RepID=A0A0C3CQM6_HEBCY|nr:glycoside hydrolase family 16 protein [Hebeloma cylindrosporum h7]
MSCPGSPHPGYASADSSLTIPRNASFGVLRRDSWQSLSESPYSFGAQSRLSTLSDKFSLPPDPRLWGSDLSPDLVEPDDDLHNPELVPEKADVTNKKKVAVTTRAITNVGCLVVLLSALIVLFIGYPIITYNSQWSPVGHELGGINSSGQVPSMGNFGLIDLDTPKDVYTKPSLRDGSPMLLVFSDEFNTDGRSFYPGDDPYWEAEDLHYWATNNMEWYDPDAVTTERGSLVITFSEKYTHDLNYQGGLITSWNKFCFTGGYIEAAAQLPGENNVVGMWPAVWTMGNLGRAGYGASLEGMWPYTYDTCDVGTAPNQTLNGEPIAAVIDGDHAYGGALSYLPGQRLSRCTCDGESHPGPKHDDGTYVGRSAPEIDVFEAQVGGHPATGEVSQSAQWAPFNRAYVWDNSSGNEILADPSISKQNNFIGSATQQATSVVTNTNQRCYELVEDCYSVYGFEYKPGYDDAYITWVSDNKMSWTLNSPGLGPDPSVAISARPVPQEPMYVIINLGMSKNFGSIDFAHLTFPNHLRIDYIRVYQDMNHINIGCDPEDFPTSAYINQNIEAYTNPNLTTWREDYGRPFPKNSFIESC